MAKSLIKSFLVYGLFGTSDVHIPFDENIKIIIGQNGIGKTQVLKIFYCILTKNFLKVTQCHFDKVELTFYNQTKIVVTKKEIIEYLEDKYKDPLIKEIIALIGIYDFEALKNESQHSSVTQIRSIINNHPRYSKLNKIASTEYIIDILKGRRESNNESRNKENESSSNLINISNKIDTILSQENILYFPTFRRIEEDFYDLGLTYNENNFLLNQKDNYLIHFGMDDIQELWNVFEQKIDSLLKEGFKDISGQIMSKLVKGFGDTDKSILDRINIDDINIILARVGYRLSEFEKLRIREIVWNKEGSNADPSLLYFIHILVNIYEEQKEFDNSINEFRRVCNKYLIGKEVYYDESEIKINIRLDNSNEPLLLNKLSSGEKQIVSIFSKIYLSEADQRFIVLFDEPELSLSMFWQQNLLPDIVNSKKCDFLFALTHSPFIFDNNLDQYAMSLNEYIRRVT